MILTNDTLLCRSKDILANNVGNDTVMMSVEKGKYYGTNTTGSYIWKTLENPMAFGELCAKLAADFNIDREQCVTEITPFIEQLKAENIIEVK